MNALNASQLTLTDLFHKRVRLQPAATAVTDGATDLSYGALALRVARWASLLQARGLVRGDRIAIWSENRIEYIELTLACARLGCILACLNWRLTGDEQLHCIDLVRPALLVVSPRHQADMAPHAARLPPALCLDAALHAEVENTAPLANVPRIHAEDGLVILYTSGTTGLPKGALISQRAMVARAMVFVSDYGIRPDDNFIAWSPLFHMAATDHSLATLLLGGKVIVNDGFDAEKICTWLETEPIGWLLAIPGVTQPLIDALARRKPRVRSVRVVGAMADLVPRQQIAELTALLQAPYINSFGSTETGLPPASSALLAPGVLPASLSKRESSWCQVRLVDDQGREPALDCPGELTVRGPTLFSGYWGRSEGDASEWQDGWFHMGDVFVRHADGSMDFVDRVKYLIKSGGENIYPAEIERVLLAHPGVLDAAVVRKPDARWGEVPVAFVAAGDASLDEASLLRHCREHLAGYKNPKEIRFVSEPDFPRNSTGKILRHEIERRWL